MVDTTIILENEKEKKGDIGLRNIYRFACQLELTHFTFQLTDRSFDSELYILRKIYMIITNQLNRIISIGVKEVIVFIEIGKKIDFNGFIMNYAI